MSAMIPAQTLGSLLGVPVTSTSRPANAGRASSCGGQAGSQVMTAARAAGPSR
jgi:hypothetical protein